MVDGCHDQCVQFVRVRCPVEVERYVCSQAYARNDLVAPVLAVNPSGDASNMSRNQRRRTARAAKKEKDAESPARKDAKPAHPKASSYGSGKDQKPQAEREAKDRKTRDRLARELCPQYLIGACDRGDSCWRKHATVDDIKAGCDRQEKVNSGKEKSGNQSDLEADIDRAETPKTKTCFQWEASGTCTYGN